MVERLRATAAQFDFAPRVVDAAEKVMTAVVAAWRARDARAFEISAKMTRAFADAGVNEGHLSGTTGYGYHDRGRQTYEALFARLMDAEAAIARLQLSSGTQAIVLTLSALLDAGDRLCSLTGRPYDTLRMALVDHPRSLAARGVKYDEVPWSDGAAPAAHDVASALDRVPDVVFVQRSRGYAPRMSLDVAAIGELVRMVRERAPNAAVVVDNCYGEFVELDEPCAVGADAVVGSLIKNPGGGMALSGAYVAGRADLVERVAERLFAPGLGAAIGPTLDANRWFFAGLHRAPHAVAESLKTMDFTAALFAELGYRTEPACGAARTDIIQAIRLGSPEKLRAFALGLQRLLPVNSRARPEPGQVPGYADPVLMADGAFVAGSTLELSCDAPMRPPFEVYLQGGLDAAHGALAVMNAASAVVRADGGPAGTP